MLAWRAFFAKLSGVVCEAADHTHPYIFEFERKA
jgi:hypothetical protein